MANFQPSSFIPKDEAAPARSRRRTRHVDAVKAIAITIFVVSLLLSVGVFFYHRYVLADIEQKQQQLAQARDAFDTELIEELARLDRRLDTAGELLDRHIVLTPLFSELGRTTLRSVRFTDFSFSDSGGRLNVELSGVALDYAGLALQSDMFGQSDMIKNPIFSGFEVDESGDIGFNVTFSVDEEMLRYVNNIQQAQQE